MYLHITPARRELLLTALHAVHNQNYLGADPADRAEYDRLYVELSAMPTEPVATSPSPSIVEKSHLKGVA